MHMLYRWTINVFHLKNLLYDVLLLFTYTKYNMSNKIFIQMGFCLFKHFFYYLWVYTLFIIFTRHKGHIKEKHETNFIYVQH